MRKRDICVCFLGILRLHAGPHPSDRTLWGRFSRGLKPHMYEQKLTQGVYESYLLSGDGAQGLVHAKHMLCQ